MTCLFPVSETLFDFLDIVDTAVATVARRLPTHVSRDDMESVAKLALVNALAQCDLTGAAARAYCYVRVRGALLDELRRLDPLSRRHRALATTLSTTRTVFSRATGRDPTAQELASETGINVLEIETISCLVAESPEPDWDLLSDNEAVGPADQAERADLMATLVAALDRLPRNQALALRRYFLEDATLDQIAAELGVSRERARQVREAGAKNLRADLIVLAAWQTLVGGNRS